ncbi:cytochrome C [bacterium]|nr:MAG: cytochrome C [bacterium]
MRTLKAAAVPALLAVLMLPAAAAAADAVLTFRQSCMSCHTIGGGRLVGPDLKDVTQRKDRAWLTGFITNPKQYLDSGDPYALKLKTEAGGAIMPPIAGMTAEQAQALLDLIDAESKLPKSQFQGLKITDEPFTPADVARGERIFLGTQRLAKGGTSCISCHTVSGLPGLSGGRLGPDLTRVLERLQGRKGLAAWLQGPVTPTMRPAFANQPLTNEEILALVAYLEAEAKTRPGPDTGASQLTFFLFGMGGAVFGLVLADAVWRRRFRSVRRALLRGER